MLKLCKVLMFGAVLVITFEFKGTVLAADNAVATRQTTGPLAYDGKVIVVDRTAKTVTVEIQKRLYLFKFGPTATVMRKGKKVRLDDVVAGQQITLQLIEASNGEVLIASAEIDPATGQAEAAGKSNDTGSGTGTTTIPTTNPVSPTIYGGSPGRAVVSPYN